MKKNKKAVRMIFVYIILTVGVQMFMYSYTNSYNRLNDKKIKPANLIVSENNAELHILDKTYNFNLNKISPENKFFFWIYLITPDELKAELLFASEYRCLQ